MSLCLVDIHGDIEGDYDTIYPLPRNATNGDMIKAIFPDITIIKRGALTCVRNIDNSDGIVGEKYFYSSWWNAPYKGVSK